uniref:Uncharacterized protein n=1 Tax=Arundo donax TaxID=35708 RepID=A0A0A9D3I4_ARUDO
MIKRRRPPSYLPASQQQALGSCLEVGHFGLDEEMDRLKHDNNILLAEVVKLRQEQQSTRADMQAMEERLQHAEHKQLQMLGFLARAMQNPDFFHQLLQHNDKIKELEDAFSKKRRRPIDIVPFIGAGGEASFQTRSEELDSTFFFGSGMELEELNEPGNSELENLALNIQGLGKRKQQDEKGGRNHQAETGETAELTDDFWEELLSEGMRCRGRRWSGDGRGGTSTRWRRS